MVGTVALRGLSTKIVPESYSSAAKLRPYSIYMHLENLAFSIENDISFSAYDFQCNDCIARFNMLQRVSHFPSAKSQPLFIPEKSKY